MLHYELCYIKIVTPSSTQITCLTALCGQQQKQHVLQDKGSKDCVLLYNRTHVICSLFKVHLCRHTTALRRPTEMTSWLTVRLDLTAGHVSRSYFSK